MILIWTLYSQNLFPLPTENPTTIMHNYNHTMRMVICKPISLKSMDRHLYCKYYRQGNSVWEQYCIISRQKRVGQAENSLLHQPSCVIKNNSRVIYHVLFTIYFFPICSTWLANIIFSFHFTGNLCQPSRWKRWHNFASVNCHLIWFWILPYIEAVLIYMNNMCWLFCTEKNPWKFIL